MSFADHTPHPTFRDGGPETVLVYDFKNTRPIELVDFTLALTALGEQYRSYIRRRARGYADSDFRLYVKEVRSGSIVAELVSYASQASVLVPVAPLIVQYAQELGELFEFFKGVKDLADVKDVLLGTTKRDLQQVNDIINPVAKDGGSQITLIAKDGGTIINHVHLTSMEANAVQNGVRRQMDAIPDSRSGRYFDQVLYWYQVRDDAAKKPGDVAVIERFDRRPVKVRFASDEVKDAMLDAPENLFKKLYVVDVEMSEVDGKPVLYRILAVKDSFDRPG